jgi:hypothetical protein
MTTGDWRSWLDAHPGFGYLLGNGVFAVVIGVVLLFADASVIPRGWSCLLIGGGATVIGAAVLLALDIDVAPGPDTLRGALAISALFFVTALYFTHPAEDLPRLLPGHDGDSQHLCVTYGLTTLLVACSALRFTWQSVSPIRRRWR